MVSKCRFLTALVFAACASSVLAQTPQFTANVDALCKQSATLNNIPGMVVAVTDGNKVIFQRAYGVISLPNGPTPNGKTVFNIGGLTNL